MYVLVIAVDRHITHYVFFFFFFPQLILHQLSTLSILPTGNKITIHKLPTGCQEDTTSYSLFALNAISHYYLEDLLLYPNPTVLVCCQMEIALDIISSMMVCLFHMI